MRKTLVLLVLAACGGGSKQAAPPETAGTSQTIASTPSESAPPAAAPAAEKKAGAALESRSGSKVTGQVTVMPMGDGVHVEARVSGASPGKHGFHFHMNGDCSAPDAKSAGDHWNPSGVAHGAPTADPHPAGDLGNMDVGADGNGTLSMHLPGVTLDSVMGKSVIFHEKEDDLKTQPSGNAGARQACGVIVEAP